MFFNDIDDKDVTDDGNYWDTWVHAWEFIKQELELFWSVRHLEWDTIENVDIALFASRRNSLTETCLQNRLCLLEDEHLILSHAYPTTRKQFIYAAFGFIRLLRCTAIYSYNIACCIVECQLQVVQPGESQVMRVYCPFIWRYVPISCGNNRSSSRLPFFLRFHLLIYYIFIHFYTKFNSTHYFISFFSILIVNRFLWFLFLGFHVNRMSSTLHYW